MNFTDNFQVCYDIISKRMGDYPSANSTTDVYSSQSVQLVPGESYTLSGYVKSNGPIASLRILYSVNGIQQSPVNSDPIMANDATAFKRVAVSFTLPSNADDTVQCCLVCSSAGGSAWFDCIQLERGLTLNHFNMLQNSTFSNSSSVLPVSWQKDTAVNNEFVSILDFDQASPVPPANLKEQMKYQYAIEDGTKGEVIVPYLNDARMPGWLGWQKYSIKDDGVDIHYVGHRFLPVRFDYKIK